MTGSLATTAPARPRELDDVTLRRAQRGDDAAFRALVETYQDAVFALLWRVAGRRMPAAVIEELAQTTFVAVYRGLPAFEIGRNAQLSTWLLTIAVRTALKVKRQHAASVALDDVADVLPAPDTTERALEHRAFGDALARALDAMAPGYRAVFVLRAYHELAYQDIAAALELDLNTVKSRLARAKAQLRAALGEFAP